MDSTESTITLAPQQQRFLKLLFKFRFVTAKISSVRLGVRACLVMTIDETLNRHESKPNTLEFGEKELREWCKAKDLLGFSNEKIIGQKYRSASNHG